MRKMLWLILLAGMLLPRGVSQAQEEWYWAVDPLTYQISSYNLSGESHSLIIADDEQRYQLFRVNTEQAVGFISVEGENRLYLLGSTTAEPLPYAGALRDMAVMVARTNDYMILLVGDYDEPDQAVAIVIDVAARTAQAIPGNTTLFFARRVWQLNSDGSGLYGLVTSAPDTWQLIEYTFSDGAVRVIQNFEDEFYPQLGYFPATQQWFYSHREGPIGQYWLINADGSRQLFAETSFQGESPAFVYLTLQNSVLKMALECDENCAYEQYSLANELLHTYPIPAEDYEILSLAYLWDDEHFVLIDGEIYWYFRPDQPPLKMTLSYLKVLSPPVQSPDQRWVLLLSEDESRFNVLDMQTGEVVYSDEMPRLLSIYYPETGALLWDVDQTWQWVDLSSGEVHDLPATRTTFYADRFADGTLLKYERNDGIYLYDPATETSTLLLSGARPLPAQ